MPDFIVCFKITIIFVFHIWKDIPNEKNNLTYGDKRRI